MLKEARELLSDESRWCKFALAKDSDGKGVGINDPSATQWCIAGACLKVGLDNREWSRLESIADQMYQESIVGVNNTLGYKFILRVLDHAIASA